MQTKIEQQTSLRIDINDPFPGLRPFSMEESHLFFGREGQSEEVLVKLSENQFVAVVGPSGSGKSSFIYCGVIPLLLGDFLPSEGAGWKVVTMRPGGGPIQNLAQSLLEQDREYLQADEETQKIRNAISVALLQSHSLGLVEAVQQIKNFENRNILILVDQFEELFRFNKGSSEAVEDSLHFVNLLMQAINSSEVPIYCIITMRSDFIGDCAFFPDLTQAINDSYYMIPQMTRDQKRRAIEGPVAVGNGQIAPRLVQQLLNDVGDNPDQLPILQHALMRTWSFWQSNRQPDEPMDIRHYEAIGKMEEALSLHANEAYDELDSEQKVICEHIFKALTDSGKSSSVETSVRRPTPVKELAEITQASVDDIIFIVEKFREPGRSLLMPPHTVGIDEEAIIDISHESLMRIWTRLKTWVEEEAESVGMYIRLSEAAFAYQVGRAALWRPPDLQLALNWKDKHKPGLNWAKRYNPAFERTMVFLEYSKQQYETEQRIKEQQQKKRLRRARLTALFLGSATIVSIGFLIFAITQQIEADRQATIAKENADKAKQQEQIALQKEKLASENEKKAQKNANEAERQTLIAQKNADEAEKQTLIAQKNADEATKQSLIAQRNADEADRQRIAAEDFAAEADKQRKEADRQSGIADQKANEARKASNNAYDLRLLSIAQSMAVKSQQITSPRIRALNAKQAYKFNSEHGGKPYHPDIYDGLYYALKLVKDKTYNNLIAHTDAVRGIAFAKGSNFFYSIGSDGKVLRWNPEESNEPVLILVGNNKLKRCLSISSDGRWLAVGGDDNAIALYDMQWGSLSPNRISIPINQVRFIAFAPSKDIFYFIGNNNTLYSYNITNKQTKNIKSFDVKVNSLAVNPVNGNIAVADDGGSVFLLDKQSRGNSDIRELTLPNTITAVNFSQDGKMLAMGGVKGRLYVWSSKTLKEIIEPLEGHTARINQIIFSNKGTQIATASLDNTVRIWNTQDWYYPPIVLRDHQDWVWTIAFNADDSRILAGCRDKLIRVWPTSLKEMASILEKEMESNKFNNFTDREWKRYVADDIKYETTCPKCPKGK